MRDLRIRNDTAPAELNPGSSRGPSGAGAPATSSAREPILCQHCGRTASNGIVCQGYCVADSGY